MLTPAEVIQFIVGYPIDDPQDTADQILRGLSGAGYFVVTKDEYLELAKRCAVADGIAATVAAAAR